MRLDKRIIDRKYIFDCFNADMAKEFIGEDCYMTNDMELFQNLDRINVYKLDKIEDGFYNEEENEYFDFCLPVRWLKSEEKQKQYRPYTINEFIEKFHFGDSIILRPKIHTKMEFHVVYNGYKAIDDNKIEFYFGPIIFTLLELFQSYERFYLGRWYPFGVLEE